MLFIHKVWLQFRIQCRFLLHCHQICSGFVFSAWHEVEVNMGQCSTCFQTLKSLDSYYSHQKCAGLCPGVLRIEKKKEDSVCSANTHIQWKISGEYPVTSVKLGRGDHIYHHMTAVAILFISGKNQKMLIWSLINIIVHPQTFDIIHLTMYELPLPLSQVHYSFFFPFFLTDK